MPETELILPPAKNKNCESLVKLIPRFDSLLHPSIHRQQWWAAAVIAVNKLPEDTTEASIMVSLANLAQVGLMLGGALGHAYLVPYRIKNSRTCQLQFGYKGYLELAYGNGFLSGVSLEYVLKGEDIRFRGTERGKRLRHDIPPLDRPEPTRENIQAAYCTYESKSGFHDVVVVGRSELLRIADNAHESSPWHSHFGGMCLVPPIRRASKRWRLTKELAVAVQCDEQTERGEQHECPELGISPAKRVTIDDPQFRNLKASLSGKAKCESDNDKDAVVSFATNGEHETLASIAGNESVCGQVLDFCKANGWEQVLAMAVDA